MFDAATDQAARLAPRPVAEIARKVRVALRRAFPGHLTGFSVRIQRNPALLRVRWCGGPEEDEAERVVDAVLEGAPVATVYARWTFSGSPHAMPA